MDGAVLRHANNGPTNDVLQPWRRQLKPVTRIAFNTSAVYGRSVLALGLALFSSRWTLSALGERDFGVYSVVGSLIVMLTFLNSVMAGSAARHFAHAIGREDNDEVRKLFNASLSIHLFVPLILILGGWPVSEFVVRHVLTIPFSRVEAAVIVLRASLISAFVSMTCVPFIAMFNAKQRIAELALWGTMQSIGMFGLAWSLYAIETDRLVYFGVGMSLISAVTQVIPPLRALRGFPECRVHLKYWFDRARTKELLGFAGWTLIGNTGVLLRSQGTSLLVNLRFGPIGNAAYGIANQVSLQVAALSTAMLASVAPEITAREGRGDRVAMVSLAQRVCLLGTHLVMLLALPLILDADNVLRLWLVDPPEDAAFLCKAMLFTALIDNLAVGYMYAVIAHGRIRAYQATVGSTLVMTLPLAWFFMVIGCPLGSVGIAFIVVQALCSIGRAVWVRHLFGVALRGWLSAVVLPCIVGGAFALGCGAIPRWGMNPGVMRLCAVAVLCSLVLVIAMWRNVLTADERRRISHAICRVCRRVARMESV